MRPAKKLLVAGLLMYLLSFGLVAIATDVEPLRGFTCAEMALIFPWDHGAMYGFNYSFRDILAWVSMLLAGWINPLFIAAMFCVRWPVIFRTLRLVVVSMQPACWIYLYLAGFYPREGYFVWLIGMMPALLSSDKK